MAGITITDPRDASDFERFAIVDAQGFANRIDWTRRWLDAARQHMRFRFARSDDEVIGGYGLMATGQYFGGRSVPAGAVAAVVVSPLWRRRGVAGLMMRDLVTVCREGGYALAPLLAATVRLYRRWGWEIVDRGFDHIVRTEALSGFRGEGEPVASPPHGELEALRRSYLHRWDGPLDRPEWWLAVEAIPEDESEPELVYGWKEDGALTGFVRYRYERRPGVNWLRVVVEEFHATTQDSQRGLLGLLAGNESLSNEVVFHYCLPSRNDLLFLLSDASKAVSVEARMCLMQRIVDLRSAFTQRGWQLQRHRLQLAVQDPVDGTQRFTAAFDDGEVRLGDGGDGSVSCTAGVLAAWYSGSLRAIDAVRMGLMSAAADDAIALDALIGGRPVWMADHF